MTIQTAFEKFHQENPLIFELFTKYAQEVKDIGFSHYSAKAVFERVRWHVAIKTVSTTDKFKLNNNFTSRYARMLITMDSTFDGFFRNRTLKA